MTKFRSVAVKSKKIKSSQYKPITIRVRKYEKRSRQPEIVQYNYCLGLLVKHLVCQQEPAYWNSVSILER